MPKSIRGILEKLCEQTLLTDNPKVSEYVDQAEKEINNIITLDKAHLELTLYTDLKKKIEAEIKQNHIPKDRLGVEKIGDIITELHLGLTMEQKLKIATKLSVELKK